MKLYNCYTSIQLGNFITTVFLVYVWFLAQSKIICKAQKYTSPWHHLSRHRGIVPDVAIKGGEY